MELAVTVQKEIVIVMKVLKMLETFVWTCVKQSTVELELNV